MSITPGGNTEQEKPFTEVFGDLCAKRAEASSIAYDLGRGLGRREPENDEQRQILHRPGELTAQIYELATAQVLKTDAGARQNLVREMADTMGRRSDYRGQRFGLDSTGFVTGVLLKALEVTEANQA